MNEDFGFNVTALLGCIVGSVTGYHFGGLVAAVDGCFFGFAASAICATLLAELSYAALYVSELGARLLDRASPLIALGVLVALASRFWT